MTDILNGLIGLLGKKKIQNVKKSLEDQSNQYTNNIEGEIVNGETCVLGIHKYGAFCYGIQIAYKTFCEEMKIPYSPLNIQKLNWSKEIKQ